VDRGSKTEQHFGVESAMALARVRARMVGAGEERPKLGRYEIVERLGGGAMGLVYRAHDETLGRDVALKVLRREGLRNTDARARFVREGRAIAALNHPNVVEVFEVGSFDGAPYIAMELVPGKNLRKWLTGERTTAEILDVFRQAACGLLAAHEVGIVHRDFKPDNVVVDDSGRVRVIDFGLAMLFGESSTGSGPSIGVPTVPIWHRLTETGDVVGTPAYMAPEQYWGDGATPASDQFSFCVTLHEALYENRPFSGRGFEEVSKNIERRNFAAPDRPRQIPARLRRILRRGLAATPEDRWPSMRPVLDAFEDAGPPRRSFIVPCVGAVVVAAAVLASQPGDAPRRCEDEARDGPWAEARRTALRERFAASTLAFADDAALRVETALDAHAEADRAAFEEACELLAGGDDRRFERSARCLRWQRASTAGLIDSLGADGDPSIIGASQAVRGLTPPERCLADSPETAATPSDPEVAAGLRSVRETLERSEAHSRSLDADAALAQARAGLVAATELRFAPAIAEAQLRIARVLNDAGRYAAAIDAYEAAYYAGIEGRHDEVAASAALQLVWIHSYEQVDMEAAAKWLAGAAAIVRQLPEDHDLHAYRLEAQANLENARGEHDAALATRKQALRRFESIFGPRSDEVAQALLNLAVDHGDVGDPDGQRERLMEALALREALDGPDHPDTALVLANLCSRAIGLRELDEARRYCPRAHALFEGAYGPNHARTVTVSQMVATLLQLDGKLDEAVPHLRRTISSMEAVYGPDNRRTCSATTQLAWALEQVGALEESERLYWSALERLRRSAPRSETLVNGLVNFGILLANVGRSDEARARYEEALTVAEDVFGPDHIGVTGPLLNLANLVATEGDRETALRMFERVVQIKAAALGEDHPDIAGTYCSMGTLASTGGDNETAYRHYERALSLWEAGLGTDNPGLVCALAGWGETLVEEHRYDEARPLLERAVAISAAQPVFPWLYVGARMNLATILWSRRSERGRARTLALQALEHCRTHPGLDEESALVEAWFEEHGVPRDRS
jgi:tetratricopeptide (TPR) repeat protein/predicted Ser/Thr protein kinase